MDGAPENNEWKPVMLIDMNGVPHGFCISELDLLTLVSFLGLNESKIIAK